MDRGNMSRKDWVYDERRKHCFYGGGKYRIYKDSGGNKFIFPITGQFEIKNIPAKQVSKETIKEMAKFFERIDKKVKWGPKNRYFLTSRQVEALFQKFWEQFRDDFDNLFPVIKHTKIGHRLIKKLMLDPDYDNRKYKNVINRLMRKVKKFDISLIRAKKSRRETEQLWKEAHYYMARRYKEIADIEKKRGEKEFREKIYKILIKEIHTLQNKEKIGYASTRKIISILGREGGDFIFLQHSNFWRVVYNKENRRWRNIAKTEKEADKIYYRMVKAATTE